MYGKLDYQIRPEYSFVELRLLITPLISLNLSYSYARHPDKELILFAPTNEPNS
jgi:hypothetical protein